MTLTPGGATSLAPYLAAYAKDRRTWPQLRELLRAKPQLGQTTFTALARDASNLETILALANERGAGTDATWLPTLLNSLLAARAYVEIAKTRKGAAAAATNDTTLTWFNRSQKLPVEVNFTEFNAGEKQLELAGTVLDRRDKAAQAEQGGIASGSSAPAKAAAAKKAAAAVASLPPKAVTLKFEALDKSGAVLGSQSVTTEALTPGKTAPFRVKIDAANAIAYRYTLAD